MDNILLSIPHSDHWKNAISITNGYSNDKKFKVTSSEGSYFIRIMNDSVTAANISEITEKLIKQGVCTPKIISSGICENSQSFIIQEWIEGELLETKLPNLTREEQYHYGVISG